MTEKTEHIPYYKVIASLSFLFDYHMSDMEQLITFDDVLTAYDDAGDDLDSLVNILLPIAADLVSNTNAWQSETLSAWERNV